MSLASDMSLIVDPTAKEHRAWQAFNALMSGRSYGQEPLNAAWHWFRLGVESATLLHRIIDRSCSTCGAGIRREQVNGVHCNGQAFEERQFTCGAELHWSPNFEKLIVQRTCPRSDENLLERRRRKDLCTAIRALVESSGVSEDFARSARSSLSHLDVLSGPDVCDR